MSSHHYGRCRPMRLEVDFVAANSMQLVVRAGCLFVESEHPVDSPFLAELKHFILQKIQAKLEYAEWEMVLHSSSDNRMF